MEIVDIFAVSDSGKLYALQWNTSDSNELERVLDFLTDPDQLYDFFKKMTLTYKVDFLVQ